MSSEVLVAVLLLMFFGTVIQWPSTVRAAEPPATQPVEVEPALLNYPRVEGLPADARYALRVNGQDVFVQHVIINPTVSAWGHRGPGAMAMFDFAGSVEVELTIDQPVNSARVRPTSRSIACQVEGQTVRFRLDKPGQFFIEINGSREYPFFLFANALELDVPSRDDPRVVYFDAGVHDTGLIDLKSDQTLYLAPGAFVNGTIRARGVKNVIIRGRGILHGGHYFHHNKAEAGGAQGHMDPPTRHPVMIEDSTNVTLEGITILDPFRWAVRPQRASNLLIENIKIVGWRKNSDGIDPCNTQNLIIRDSFIKTQDDGISIKGTDPTGVPTRNILVERMTMFSNWMRPFVVGGEARGSVMEQITFRDCDIIHSGFNPNSQHSRDAAMGVYSVDDGLMQNILFENIRVENAHRLIRVGIVENQHSAGRGRGHIRNVTFRHIRVTEGEPPVAEITGHNADHLVDGVKVENLTIHGRPVRSLDDWGLVTNDFVRNVRVDFQQEHPSDQE